jgi:effector-binding domain-containing protein
MLMKAFKYIFILLLIVIVGGAVYFSVKDGTYDITKTQSIEAPPSLIFDEIKDFKQWINWNPSLNNEEVFTTMGAKTEGIDGNYSFTDAQGTGKMTITGIEPNKSLTIHMFYDNGITSSNSEIVMGLVQIENGTQITWNIKGEQNLLDKAMSSILRFDKEEIIALNYEKALVEIEDIVLNNMTVQSSYVDGIIETGGGYFLFMSSSSKKENLPELKNQMLQTIRSYMRRNQIDMYGVARVIYEKKDAINSDVIFSTAIPIQNKEITALESNVLCSYLKPGKAVKITLKGAYNNLEEAWRKGEKFIAQNGLAKSEEAPYEIYKTNPVLTPNPANYLTEIYLPIQ